MIYDIFNFEVADKINSYDSNTLAMFAKLKTNNFKQFDKKYTKFLDFIRPKMNNLSEQISKLGKGLNNGVVTPSLLNHLDQLKHELDYTKTKMLHYCPEYETELVIIYNEINKAYLSIDDNQFLKSGEFTEILLDYIEWFSSKITKKAQMCERLKTLENQNLKVLVNFSEKGYETHFIKYHMNLENYSDILHQLLKLELEDKFVNKYNKLEQEHFELISQINESMLVKDFITQSASIMQNYEEMYQLKEKFLKVQIKHNEIETNIKDILDKNRELSKKLTTMLSLVKKNKKSKKITLKGMSLCYDLPLNKFFQLEDNNLIKDEIVEFLNKKDIKLYNNLLLPVLELIEPESVREIKNRIISLMRKQQGYETINKKSQFMIKKNERNIFENSQYYSHTMILYQFYPKSIEEVKNQNKYITTSGYEKIFLNKKMIKISSKIYSKLLKKEVSFIGYLELHYYNLNPHYNSKYSAVS